MSISQRCFYLFFFELVRCCFTLDTFTVELGSYSYDFISFFLSLINIKLNCNLIVHILRKLQSDYNYSSNSK